VVGHAIVRPPTAVSVTLRGRPLAPGHGRLRIATVRGRSVVIERQASSPLRLLSPRSHGTAAWVTTCNFGGGLVDGDDVRLTVEVGEGAAALVSGQAPAKAYRSPRGVRQVVQADVRSGALLVLLPEAMTPFADARLEQLVDIDLAANAAVVATETLTAGRVATGERWAFERVATRLRVRRAGGLVLDDALLLDRAHGGVAERMGPFNAWATAILLGSRVAEERPVLEVAAPLLETVAPLAGGCLVRLAGRSPEALALRLRTVLSCVSGLLQDDPFSHRWQ
jgi:urease accessory protein